MTDLHYDCEFDEDGETIELISIAFVAANGDEYYGINWDADLERIHRNSWLMTHVVPTLPLIIEQEHGRDVLRWDLERADFDQLKQRRQIRDEVKQFINSFPEPQLWAWYGAYDHVALAQLFGRMIDLPTGIPMWTNDLRQECERLGNPRLPEQPAGKHNALEDARHNLVRAQALAEVAARR